LTGSADDVHDPERRESTAENITNRTAAFGSAEILYPPLASIAVCDDGEMRSRDRSRRDQIATHP